MRNVLNLSVSTSSSGERRNLLICMTSQSISRKAPGFIVTCQNRSAMSPSFKSISANLVVDKVRTIPRIELRVLFQQPDVDPRNIPRQDPTESHEKRCDQCGRMECRNGTFLIASGPVKPRFACWAITTMKALWSFISTDVEHFICLFSHNAADYLASAWCAWGVRGHFIYTYYRVSTYI